MPLNQIGKKKAKCKVCKTPFTRTKPFETWCSPDCGYKLAVELTEKKKAKEKLAKKRERIKAKKEFKERDRPHQVKLTQVVVNKYVVYVQEAGKGCYTCDNPLLISGEGKGGLIDCGHWLTRGAHPEKARDTRHMRRQCIRCNRYNGGRPEVFEANLRKELGDDVVDEIRSYKPGKATCEDLIEMRKHYSKLLRDAGVT